MTTSEIARKLGIETYTVKSTCKRLGITGRYVIADGHRVTDYNNEDAEKIIAAIQANPNYPRFVKEKEEKEKREEEYRRECEKMEKIRKEKEMAEQSILIEVEQFEKDIKQEKKKYTVGTLLAQTCFTRFAAFGHFKIRVYYTSKEDDHESLYGCIYPNSCAVISSYVYYLDPFDPAFLEPSEFDNYIYEDDGSCALFTKEDYLHAHKFDEEDVYRFTMKSNIEKNAGCSWMSYTLYIIIKYKENEKNEDKEFEYDLDKKTIDEIQTEKHNKQISPEDLILILEEMKKIIYQMYAVEK